MLTKAYLERGDLFVQILGRGFAWLDTGTHASLVEASHFVQILEQRQGLRIACPEEIALRLGYISREHFFKIAQKTAKSSYGEYLLSVYQSLRAPSILGLVFLNANDAICPVNGLSHLINSGIVFFVLQAYYYRPAKSHH